MLKNQKLRTIPAKSTFFCYNFSLTQNLCTLLYVISKYNSFFLKVYYRNFLSRMDVDLGINKLEQLLFPLGYKQDLSQAKPIFWKNVRQNDLRNPYAFSLVIVTLDQFTVFIEGLNEPRLKRAIDAGIIEINSPEDVEALKEIVFETTLDNQQKLETVLPFFEEQLTVIETEPIYSSFYKRALANIELLIEAANEVEY